MGSSGTGKPPRRRVCGRKRDRAEGAGGGGGPDPEQLLRQVPALIDAPVHGHEALQARLVPDVGVVKAGVQHDHREGQHVARVCIGQSGGDDWGIWAPRTREVKPPAPSFQIGRASCRERVSSPV